MPDHVRVGVQNPDSLGAACPLPPSADIRPRGQSLVKLRNSGPMTLPTCGAGRPGSMRLQAGAVPVPADVVDKMLRGAKPNDIPVGVCKIRFPLEIS